MTTKIHNNDQSKALQAQVRDAIKTDQALNIQGGNSKSFYGNTKSSADLQILDASQHTGIVDYDPTELAITVCAGTRIRNLEALLAENQQILPFEPPCYSEDATIGGAIASGISGPRRAYTGSARDTILGVQIINGEGEIANFGGQVMKNVAGYDMSRLMVRSMGTLGVILNVSLRVLPKPQYETTLRFDASQPDALAYFRLLRKKQQIISGTLWFEGNCYLRLSGTQLAVQHSADKLSGSEIPDADQFWADIKDHKTDFFQQDGKPLWRLSLPASTPAITSIEDNLLIEWGGALRWVYSNSPPNIIHSIANKHGGYATLFKGNVPNTPCFPPLEPALFKLHKQLKNKMDPKGIFNPCRLYESL
ncbi:MAG TPA: glycolate oxidase subunit GlcE [Leucothrix mucor]|nr:glycolate oxidase subunit GlcE [Leucothrix mucor]